MDGLVQFVSLAGAALILVAFVALQRSFWTSTARMYLWCNFAGAALLTVVAVRDGRLGFIVLEGVWAVVSLVSIVRPAPRR